MAFSISEPGQRHGYTLVCFAHRAHGGVVPSIFGGEGNFASFPELKAKFYSTTCALSGVLVMKQNWLRRAS